MSSHFQYFPSDNVVVTPFNAQYSYPSQANKSVKMTPRIPPKNGTNFSPGQQIRLEFPAQGYVNPANTMLVMDVVLIAPANTGAFAVRFQNNIQSIFNRVTLKYGGGPQEDILQYGLLVRLLTETTSTGQNNNINQMAIADGIGGSVTGSVPSQYASAVTPTAITSDGTTVTVTITNTSFKIGQYITFTGVSVGSYDLTDKYFQITEFVSSTGLKFLASFASGSTFTLVSASAYPTQNAVGLLNARQSQIQGIEGNFEAAVSSSTIPDDTMLETKGTGLGSVPNTSVSTLLPGGMTTPTVAYSVRRYMINFALGLFTQDKLIPTKWMASQLAIEITLELPENCIYQPVGLDTNTSSPNYAVGNVALIPEIIEFDDVYDNNFLSALEAGGVPIKFSTWNYFQFTTQGSSKLQLSITERSRSVKGILAVQRRAQGSFAYDSHACVFDSSPLTLQTTKGSTMREFQYRIGGRYFPGQPVEFALNGQGTSNGGAEGYTELAKFLNIVGDARLSTSIIPHNWAVQAITDMPNNLLPEYDYSYSCVGHAKYGQPHYIKVESKFSAYCGNAPSCMFTCATNFETSNGLEISGLNAEEQSDISFLVTWTEAQSPNHQIEVFTYCDRMLVLKVNLCFNSSQTTMWILSNNKVWYI